VPAAAGSLKTETGNGEFDAGGMMFIK